MTVNNITEQLIRDEGNIPYAYRDQMGLLTIGVGFLIDKDRGGGLRPEEISFILYNRINKYSEELEDTFPWYRSLSEPRRAVLLGMRYNLGLAGLKGFKRMLKAFEESNWEEAAKEMEDSRWFHQVGPRAKRLQKQLLEDMFV